jgi:outer membrane protein OmpA-like peptidoglycan-associated protein
MKLRIALLAASVLAVPLAARAQPVNGLYVGAGIGLNLLQDETINHSTGLGTDNSMAAFNPGYLGEVSVGYGLGALNSALRGFRVELEGDYASNSLQNIGTGYGNPATIKGGQDEYGMMANVLYDIDPSMFGINEHFVYPYLGVGAGYGGMNLTGTSVSFLHTPEVISGGSNTVGGFAYQGILGLSFPVSAVPGLSITTEYRMLAVMDPQGAYHGSVTSGGTTVARGNLDFGNEFNHEFILGVRYAFGAAPPPPPPAPAPVAAPAPAPAPARTYLVFFDWDKADLTDRAKQIIAEAAQASTRVQYTRIDVNGYTDLSGTAKYNQKLSLERANNVAAQLVSDGVPKNVIDIQGFGETHPLVPTANGVREPQNRRVEIIIK